MRREKSKVYPLLVWAVSALAVLVIASCNDRFHIPDGKPYMKYEVTGTVMNAYYIPLEGIQVQGNPKYGDFVTKTDSYGKFTLKGQAWPADSIKIIVSDIDEEEHGGKYGTVTFIVTLVKSEEKDADPWCEGHYYGPGVEVYLPKVK